MIPEISIVACANARPPIGYLKRGFDAFLASARSFGYEPTLLGWQQLWTGLGNKPKLLKKAIEDKVITTPYLLFCDAFDVVILKDPETLPRKFIWNAEKNCFPEAGMACDFEQVSSPYKFLNSGVCFAPTEAMYEALKEMKADEIPVDHWDGNKRVEPNDQWYWQMQFLHGTVPMELDHDCDFFQTLHAVEEIEIKDPYVVHANGDKNHPYIVRKQEELLSLAGP